MRMMLALAIGLLMALPLRAEVKLENLLQSDLAQSENTEVFVSKVTVPPNTELPKHYHPGEEFAYILEGSITLEIDGEEPMTGKAGDAVTVPLKAVHRAYTGDEAAVVLVFRVHEKGQPQRVLVEE